MKFFLACIFTFPAVAAFCQQPVTEIILRKKTILPIIQKTEKKGAATLLLEKAKGKFLVRIDDQTPKKSYLIANVKKYIPHCLQYSPSFRYLYFNPYKNTYAIERCVQYGQTAVLFPVRIMVKLEEKLKKGEEQIFEIELEQKNLQSSKINIQATKEGAALSHQLRLFSISRRNYKMSVPTL